MKFLVLKCIILERGLIDRQHIAEGNFWQNEKDALYGINGFMKTLQDRVL